MARIRFSLVLTLAIFASLASAQQTGVAVATKPGAAARTVIVARSIVPEPSCETSARDAGGGIASLPEMLFGRGFNELICVRHVDGKTEKLDALAPHGVPSADGSAIAYWNEQKQELHIYLTASQSDRLVESLTGTKVRNIVWSSKGHLLSYFSISANHPGIHSFNLDTGQRNVFPGSFIEVVAAPDVEHVAAVGRDGVETFSVVSGKRENVAAVKFAAIAQYSAGGKYLGILSNESIAAQNAPPAPPSTNATEDDTPDCGGGSLALILQDVKSKQLRDVPYPNGFDTALDFAISPDERAIAVTFGVAGCDYPGDRAQVFLVSLPDLKLTPISPEDQLSVKPVWSPDGKVLIYSDYSGSDSPLVAFDLATRKTTRITKPGEFGPDEWLGWR